MYYSDSDGINGFGMRGVGKEKGGKAGKAGETVGQYTRRMIGQMNDRAGGWPEVSMMRKGEGDREGGREREEEKEEMKEIREIKEMMEMR